MREAKWLMLMGKEERDIIISTITITITTMLTLEVQAPPLLLARRCEGLALSHSRQWRSAVGLVSFNPIG